MSRTSRTLPVLRFAPAVLALALAPSCFEEPAPVDDGSDTVVMCIQAPCTDTDAPVTTGPETSGMTESGPSSTGPADSGSSSEGADSTGPVPTCGDGEINQPTEMCDSTSGCRDDCTFEDYACNPLNDADCIEGLRCGAVDVRTETFTCMLPGDGGVGSPCTGVPNNDGDCQAGLTCLFNFNTPLCDMGNCCVEYCSIIDPAFRCAGGATCRPFFIASMYQGLEHLGFCGEP